MMGQIFTPVLHMHQAFLSTKMHQSSEANMIFSMLYCIVELHQKGEQEHYQTQEDNFGVDSIQGVEIR